MAHPLVIAFVQGAQWWEHHKEGATMWQSDRHLAEEEALKRKRNLTLGLPTWLPKEKKE